MITESIFLNTLERQNRKMERKRVDCLHTALSFLWKSLFTSYVPLYDLPYFLLNELLCKLAQIVKISDLMLAVHHYPLSRTNTSHPSSILGKGIMIADCSPVGRFARSSSALASRSEASNWSDVILFAPSSPCFPLVHELFDLLRCVIWGSGIQWVSDWHSRAANLQCYHTQRIRRSTEVW